MPFLYALLFALSFADPKKIANGLQTKAVILKYTAGVTKGYYFLTFNVFFDQF